MRVGWGHHQLKGCIWGSWQECSGPPHPTWCVVEHQQRPAVGYRLSANRATVSAPDWQQIEPPCARVSVSVAAQSCSEGTGHAPDGDPDLGRGWRRGCRRGGGRGRSRHRRDAVPQNAGRRALACGCSPVPWLDFLSLLSKMADGTSIPDRRLLSMSMRTGHALFARMCQVKVCQRELCARPRAGAFIIMLINRHAPSVAAD